ncbi:conjugal transfer protein TraF [Teredinibacter haidensis]|uniref:conjugal transfer protein TraF n=1 Tax=Teredinibacter haidensis TaxID=2731755 RepID=UPI000948DC95|nr:conjugal transfer protein TraF [Teredinibacter haidensis]
MKKIVVVAALGALAVPAYAGSNGIYIGPNHTTGDIPSEYSVFAANTNPAAAALVVAEEDSFRINYLPSIWNANELGKVDNFIDDLDELIDILDDPSLAEGSVSETLERFNTVLVEMGESGYSKTSIGLTAPILPLYHYNHLLEATFFADFSYGATIGMSVLDDELTFDPQNLLFSTNTSAYIKSGIEARLSGGMSKKLYTFGDDDGLELYGGFKLNVIHLRLSKQLIALQQLNGESIEDVVEDSYDENLESTSNMSLDIGVLLVAERYRAGLTITDINSPSYNYGAVGTNCDRFSDASIERSNCDTAAYFVQAKGEIIAQEQHTQEALATVSGVFNLSRKWMVSGELELAEYDDIVGHQNQWLNLGTAYNTNSNVWPSFRIGYRKNMAGSELSSVNLGFTLFGRLTLDGSWGMESTEVDGTTVPRMFGFSVGFQQKF